jgi:hypothetical protein
MDHWSLQARISDHWSLFPPKTDHWSLQMDHWSLRRPKVGHWSERSDVRLAAGAGLHSRGRFLECDLVLGRNLRRRVRHPGRGRCRVHQQLFRACRCPRSLALDTLADLSRVAESLPLGHLIAEPEEPCDLAGALSGQPERLISVAFGGKGKSVAQERRKIVSGEACHMNHRQ